MQVKEACEKFQKDERDKIQTSVAKTFIGSPYGFIAFQPTGKVGYKTGVIKWAEDQACCNKET